MAVAEFPQKSVGKSQRQRSPNRYDPGQVNANKWEKALVVKLQLREALAGM